MTATILVVDDQSSVRQLLQEYLTEQGFKVITASDGQTALYTARHEEPDLILLDIMMPKMDGYQFLRVYRQERQTPIIIITAREEETDAVLGLDLGADDYVVKPFRLRELTARIRATLRRSMEGKEPTEILHVGEVWLDTGEHTVKVRGQEVALTPLEFDLLATLMRSPGRVFTREELAERLSDSGFAGINSTLNIHVRNLRKKIELNPSDPVWIETVFGVGYRFRKPE
ncbi:response regulators consisting of a CheY-like receiver domain and a winged-helix DNA-binding domain [Anaerolinea thermolimosa]|uniref:response regulator transcription factor n=1 Tax=Anaerolinea thermolimosa TaxID=229919 RepID=UPI000783446D|nr:response regulator transcription factor [Anaerolinea thermolimosa]GAP06840.1 response regulators consisting of a CheY-like receiver domain and a winged-helix DNA-binding domain [Anaerolinea thermolimosa]